jgi:hypothetical protein
MSASEASIANSRSRTWATWIAILGGSLGLHRFYLHGVRDIGGWLHPLPTLIGLYGVTRMRSLGQDDQLAWVLIPWLGITISAAMLAAIVYGLTPDEKWDARFNGGEPSSAGGWSEVLGAILALMIGAVVLISTIAFVSQRYFEYQADPAISTTARPPDPTPLQALNG